MFFCGLFFIFGFCSQNLSGPLAAARNDSEAFRHERHGDRDLLLLQEASVLEVVGDNREATLQRDYGKSGAVQADLKQIHLLGRQMSIGVDIGEAPLQSEGDEIGLSGQSRCEAEAILV